MVNNNKRAFDRDPLRRLYHSFEFTTESVRRLMRAVELPVENFVKSGSFFPHRSENWEILRQPCKQV